MNRVNTATSLLVAMIFLAVATPLWLTPYTLQMKEYGIILRFEGDKPVIDGKEICKNIAGNVIIKFGNEFQSIDVCEFIEKKVIHVPFSEGVEYWVKTLNELGIKPGMSADEVIKTLRSRGYGGVTMPTVSITFWLISEDLHYIANYALTSLDYYYYMRGYDYFQAFNKMFENPLAIVEEHATIIIRSEDLARSFAVINMSRALDEVRKKLGLPELSQELYDSTTTTQTDCPPGWQRVIRGFCERKNYWNLPTTPPDWFSERIIYYPGGDKSEVVQELWNKFLEAATTAYLYDRNLYPEPPPGPPRGLSARCGTDFVNVPIKMDTVITYCLSETFWRPPYAWNDSKTPDSEFTIYKPFVITFVSSMSDIPPLLVQLTYNATQAGFKRTGFSIMGVPIFANQGYSVSGGAKTVTFTSADWAEGARRVALIVPTYVKYLYDALIFYWNIREYGAYVDGEFRRYWLFEPVPIITPYYKETGWAPDSYWSACYYDASGNLKGGGISCVQNINNLINNMTETFEKDYYVIKDTTFNNIPRWYQELLDTSRFNTTEYGNLGSILFGIVKILVVELFLGSISGPYSAFLLFLNFIDYEDTTFMESVVVQYLEWRRLGGSSNIPVMVQKITKYGYYLSNNYGEIGKQPLVAEYIVIIGSIGVPPLPCFPDDPSCPLPLEESES